VWADPPTAVRFRVKKPAISALASFQKLPSNFKNLLPNRSKGFELVGFEKLSGNSKAFGAKLKLKQSLKL
jgi:hypothetical protein